MSDDFGKGEFGSNVLQAEEELQAGEEHTRDLRLDEFGSLPAFAINGLRDLEGRRKLGPSQIMDADLFPASVFLYL